jgi:hypothetical protein
MRSRVRSHVAGLLAARTKRVSRDIMLRLPLQTALLGGVLYGPAPCSQAPLGEQCNGSRCHPDNSNCPPVSTHPSCGEHPHSGRDGALLTWGKDFRAGSAQECCDKCKAHPKHCNSWTFCPLPVCWGLDSGNNHTFGECWLRRLQDVQADSSFRQRGKYTQEWLHWHRRVRPGCKHKEPWHCSPTHVPYTSGAIGGPPYDPTAEFRTGGKWGNVWVKPGSGT